MEIDYFSSGSADCPLLRIYVRDLHVCKSLWKAIHQLANRMTPEVCITELPGVVAKESCVLVARASDRDLGIRRQKDLHFKWLLTPAMWENVAGLVEPFCLAHVDAFQWLDQSLASDARVLLTTTGHW